jgi:hypothetical protein
MPPLICVHANCQGQALAGLLARHPGLQGAEFVFLRAWLGDEPTAEQLSRCQLLIRQNSFALPAFAQRLPAAARQIVVPLLACSVLWPFAFDKPDEPAGWRFPYGDRYLIGQLRQGRSPQQAADDYLALDVAARVRLDRLLAMEVQRWQQDDQKCDVQLAAFIEANLLRERLFFTPDHPTDRLLIELANRVLALLGQPPFGTPDWAHHQHALRGVEVPLHPAIVRHFALPFAAVDQRYPLHGGWLECTTHDYYQRHAAALATPGISEAMHEAAAALQAGDLKTAFNIAWLVRTRYPAHSGASATLAVASALLGQREQAAQLLRASFPVAESV